MKRCDEMTRKKRSSVQSAGKLSVQSAIRIMGPKRKMQIIDQFLLSMFWFVSLTAIFIVFAYPFPADITNFMLPMTCMAGSGIGGLFVHRHFLEKYDLIMTAPFRYRTKRETDEEKRITIRRLDD